MSPRTRKIAAWTAAACALALVFSLYLRPDFMVTMSNAIWACFGL